MTSSSASTVTFRRTGVGEDEQPSAPRLTTAALYDCANFLDVLADGWSTIEDGFVWSCSEAAVLRFPHLAPRDYVTRLSIEPFSRPDRLPVQRVGIVVNDVDLGEVTLDGPGALEFKLSPVSETQVQVVRLRLPDAAKPCDVEPGNPDDRLLGIALRQLVIYSPVEASTDSAVEIDRTQWPELSDEAKADLMKCFESLGENCEFGLVQRRCGAEPLGLLRFSSAPLSKLLAALEARFEGMGARDNIQVELSSNEREYMIQDRAFGFYYHAWVNAGDMTPEKIQAREAARVPFLVRKLCEDLTEGSKIFVFHAMQDMSTASALKLAAAIRRYGPGTLLWVRLSDTAHPPGSTERIADGLMAGYVDRFAPGGNAYDLSLDCWVEVCRSARERCLEPVVTPVRPTRCVPPYAIMNEWLAACAVPGTTRIRPTYDDVLDVLRAMIAIVPVDEEWYLAQYPDVSGFLTRLPDETATSHFRKHGYFNGRLPFADGWQGLRAPVRFTELTRNLRIVPARGLLYAEMEREDFLAMIRVLLRTVSVDEQWYRSAYPEAAHEIDGTRIATAAEHYAASGYFKGWLPVDVDVDPEWYVARYGHVRNGLAAGVATSAKDHFMRIGYGEGCRPTRP